MAAEPWNRINIALPGALSRVRVPFTSATDASVKALLVENEKALKLLRSTILQTEVRLLYELLYILNNSSRGNKTFKGLQQVEQCFNRLKSMKLDVALQELTELCPNRIQRGLSIKAGECDVPSQPMLEWFCLKVLGGAQLMSCMLNRCSRAFLLSKQQMKWEEFVILNVVLTSTLSRLWVIVRGVLVSLATLYQQLLELRGEVANARPMPFLTDFSLPADMAQFLCPSHAFLLTKKTALGPRAKHHKPSVKVKKQGWKRKIEEDLGVAVERGRSLDSDMKPFLKVFKDFTKSKSFPQKTHKADKKQKFKKQVRAAATFTDMAMLLEEMIPWCESQNMEKEKRLLTFLQLKCQRMKCLEAAGYNVQRRLQAFRQEACWASSPQGSMPKTCRPPIATRRLSRLRTRFQSLKSQLKSSKVRTALKKKPQKRERKRTELSGLLGDDQRNRTICAESSQAGCDSGDDIDDIFASAGL